MAPIQKKSLVDQVYETLRHDIITLAFPLGSKVNANELQSSLGVSITPIREAVNRLQQEGLVTYEPNVGARVLTLDAHDVEEIQQLAMTLHCAAIRLAMARAGHAALAAELRRYIELIRLAESEQGQVSAVNQLIGVFYHSCGNSRLDRSMVSVQGQQLLLRHIYASHDADRGADLADFERMAEQVEAGDVEAVCGALQRYTDRMSETILASL